MDPRRLRSFAARLLGALSCLMCAAPAAGKIHADAAIARATRDRLWDSAGWWRLLHYRSSIFGVQSQVDGAAFFLAEQGRSDPKAELVATLRAFYEPIRRGRELTHARCRFPARFAWLERRLALGRELPAIACPELDRFLAEVVPERVTLLYAANNVDSPVSAFGHTFLRFVHRSGDLAVEYRPEPDKTNPLSYAFQGLAGMYEARFYVQPLNDKLSEYLDGELRDVWEYELALSAHERRQLGRHLWELSSTFSDYYYMTENCSFGVLALLEAAAPRLDLIERTHYVVFPVDTLRAVYDTPGLVRSVRFRPARSAAGRAHARDYGPLPPAATPWSDAPHAGHASLRLMLGNGLTSQYDDAFATIGYRIALHDLADPPLGQPALSQIQFMDTKLRYELRRRRLTLNELTFAELMVLHPLGARAAPSWRARGYGKRLHDPGCAGDDCFAHGLNGSIGLGLGTSDLRAVAFLMADAYLLFSEELDGIDGSFVRAGLGPFAGLRLHGPGQLVAELLGSWSYLPAQAEATTFELGAKLRTGLAESVALGTELSIQPSATELQLASYFYF